MTTADIPSGTVTTRSQAGSPQRSRAWNTWVGALVAGLTVGAFCFFWQWTHGLGVTGLSNTVTWGMYIISFMFLVGVSAGGLIVVAGSELVESHRFEQLNRLAVVVSAAAVATAAGSLLPDLGRPQLVWKMLVHPQLSSPLLWDMVVITAYLTIACVDLWLLTRRPVNQVAMRRMAIITLPVAVAVHSVTAWIFGLLVARPFWNSALMAPLFLSSAMVSGTAMIILVAITVRRTTSFSFREDVIERLGRLMLWFIAADAFLLFAEILTTYTSGQPDHLAQLDELLTGKLAPVFWAEILVGVVVPFVIFSRTSWRKRTGLVVTASVLTLVGVFFKRINILLSSLFEPLVGLSPGIPGGRPGQEFTPDAIYIPTWVEWGVLVGMAAFFFSLVTLGVRRIVLTHADD
ncbi:MAG: polysulfide reductase NrfD [Acidimicrobiia bacterium]|nr:polysulfide reductase NrfD [Acidimicrobiia bacterium]